MSLFLRKQKGSSGLIWACGVKSNSSILEEEEKHEEGENYGFVDGKEGEGRGGGCIKPGTGGSRTSSAFLAAVNPFVGFSVLPSITHEGRRKGERICFGWIPLCHQTLGWAWPRCLQEAYFPLPPEKKVFMRGKPVKQFRSFCVCGGGGVKLGDRGHGCD